MKQFMYEHGAHWGVALAAVLVNKLYTEGEDQSMRSVIRSIVAAVLFTFLSVKYGIAQGYEATTISLGVFFGSFLIDVVVELLMHLKRKMLSDPDGVLHALKTLWGRRK